PLPLAAQPAPVHRGEGRGVSTLLDSTIAHIAKCGALRTDALAAHLGLSEGYVDNMLEPACIDGRLTTCRVMTGDRQVIEYRCSASGGSLKFTIATAARKTYQPPLAHRVAATVNDHAEPKGEHQMSVREQIEAALKAHGPMTTR